ncbi:NAD(P)-binding domain-containing protein, partial [Dietzia sp. KRD202]|uniref:NAD(P)-binding domain-containing protein n=1 Tax=Dietzia sp. KRD202 TaxID=2729732 RepID=UPI001F4977BE
MKDNKLAIIGLGYVGIPLAVEFVKKGFEVIGFDINTSKIEGLKKGLDETGEVAPEDLETMQKITFTNNEKDLKQANIY